MANVKGMSLKGLNMIATYKDSQINEESKRGFLTIQLDQRGLKGKEDSNPYLTTYQCEGGKMDGKISHSDSYALDQIKAIEAAGKSVIVDDLHVIAFKGDLFTTKKDKTRGPKLVVNTKDALEKSDFALSKKTLEKQNELTQKAKEAKKAAMAQKEVPEAPAMDGAEQEMQAEA